MPGIKYITRVLRGVRFEKLNYVMGVVKQKSGHSKARTFCDILWCAARYGAGYYDYVMFGFYAMNGRQRDTYLTRVRNKKVCELMNQPGYGDEFDDKLRFNVRFADFLGRRTLNAAAATPDELSAFLQGLDCFFAKPSRGTCGNGIEKLRTADWPDAEKLLAYLKEKGLDVLEEPLAQHPDMAKLHPQSVNTMRIVTDRVGDTVHIAYIVLKIGRGDGFCDNSGQGGVICRVDEKTGKICSVATDDYFNVYETHPDTGIRFEGYQPDGAGGRGLCEEGCARCAADLPRRLGRGDHAGRPRAHRGQRLPRNGSVPACAALSGEAGPLAVLQGNSEYQINREHSSWNKSCTPMRGKTTSLRSTACAISACPSRPT